MIFVHAGSTNSHCICIHICTFTDDIEENINKLWKDQSNSQLILWVKLFALAIKWSVHFSLSGPAYKQQRWKKPIKLKCVSFHANFQNAEKPNFELNNRLCCCCCCSILFLNIFYALSSSQYRKDFLVRGGILFICNEIRKLC